MRSLPFIITIAAMLLTGCISQQQPAYKPVLPQNPKLNPKLTPKPKPRPKPAVVLGKPTKVKELKEVQDNNFNPEYMYPDTPKRTLKAPAVSQPTNTIADASSNTMSRETCIGMIGQAKFDKYTQMLGSESAAIKRCILLRSMK